MGYRGQELTDLASPLESGIDRFARRTTERVGGNLKSQVRRHTPVSKTTPAQVLSFGTQGAERMRHGRPHGALRDSWQVGDVDVRVAGSGRVYTIPVFTLDPVAPHVEWDTRPHLIVAKGKLLTVPTDGGLVFARQVEHPGTTGAHMMATALQEIAAMWRTTARRMWAEESRRIWEARV